MVDNYSIKAVLPGNAQAVWEKLISKAGYATRRDAFQGLADEYRSFVDARITDWRRHRLFGIEPEFPNNWEDLRGQDCLISINADTLLQTCSEHEYGMSVWLPTDDMRRGRYDRGQFVRHCAV